MDLENHVGVKLVDAAVEISLRGGPLRILQLLLYTHSESEFNVGCQMGVSACQGEIFQILHTLLYTQ